MDSGFFCTVIIPDGESNSVFALDVFLLLPRLPKVPDPFE